MFDRSHVLLIDAAGGKLLSQIDPGCEQCLKSCHVESELTMSCGKSGPRRRGILTSEAIGTAFLCSPEANDLSSSKRFRAKLSLLHGTLPMAIDVRNAARTEGRREASRIVHNLRTLSGRVSLEIYSLANQDSLTADAQSQLNTLKRNIAGNQEETASALLRLLKNSQAMSNEFAVLERLNPQRRIDIKPLWHTIHKVVKNSTSLFFQELQQKSIKISQSNCNYEVLIDYETFSAGFYYILENACKYSAHSSSIAISFVSDGVGSLVLSLSMNSLEVKCDEADKIFSESYSGEAAIARKSNGMGLGMFLARELFQISGIGVQFYPGVPTRNSFKEMAYAQNTLEITFPKAIVKLGLPPRTVR
ncbi:HAMP domain-containing histidine kinase [Burkholderia sp. PAMC 26561]|uniref:HAMP domain-containing histidine kinase n=1 Tax=Burkholderia sp. PAMC 26561 TaxID=1795043 RepID=UPI000AECAE90|nr:HAMP domain-containing histidine kinase [Burkholderia sp. PAMC 26561]